MSLFPLHERIKTLSSAMSRPPQTVPSVHCCLCGTVAPADRMVEGMCIACTNLNVDITAGIERTLEVEMCRTCSKWYRNPQWIAYEHESPELLSMCLRRIRGLKRLTLVDARWIWTEPHCRRLKVKSHTRFLRAFVTPMLFSTSTCHTT